MLFIYFYFFGLPMCGNGNDWFGKTAKAKDGGGTQCQKSVGGALISDISVDDRLLCAVAFQFE